MMNRIPALVIMFAALLAFTGCDKGHAGEGECISYYPAPVTLVEGPATAAVNQEIDLLVSFTCSSGCGHFGNFEKTTSGDTTHISVIAKYQGCVCTMDMPVRQTTYTFKAAQAGTYYLKFRQTENDFLTDTITVL